MNWLKKGPELKMPKLKMPSLKRSSAKEGGAKGPSIKPPAFLADLYYDMRDRRLLPIVALVLVAIVAVPFLMGADSESLSPPSTGAPGPEAVTAKASKLTVVEATPGLRDYRKRLGGRSATDPFEQQYTESSGGGSGSASEGSSSSSTSSPSGESVTIEDSSTTTEVDPGSDGGMGGSPPSGEGGGGTHLIEFVFDVQVSHSEATADGGQKMSEPQVRRRLPTFSELPGEKAPAVSLVGVNLHNGKVYVLVSDDVESLEGEFTCVTRTPDGLCELLEVDAGFPFEAVYGPNQTRYRFKVVAIDAVSAGKVGDDSSSARAAFGGTVAKALPRGSGSVSEIAG